MPISPEMNMHLPFVREFARWWRCWRKNKVATELNCCGIAEAEQIARDESLNTSTSNVLAGKWPDPALSWRHETNLDPKP